MACGSPGFKGGEGRGGKGKEGRAGKGKVKLESTNQDIF
jgi:hypothetical protein